MGSKRLLTLTHRAQVKRFTQDLLKLLKSQASKQVIVREFLQAYHWWVLNETRTVVQGTSNAGGFKTWCKRSRHQTAATLVSMMWKFKLLKQKLKALCQTFIASFSTGFNFVGVWNGLTDFICSIWSQSCKVGFKQSDHDTLTWQIKEKFSVRLSLEVNIK